MVAWLLPLLDFLCFFYLFFFSRRENALRRPEGAQTRSRTVGIITMCFCHFAKLQILRDFSVKPSPHLVILYINLSLDCLL